MERRFIIVIVTHIALLLHNSIQVGCLTTRSPHRPNPIGLSVVRITAVLPNGIIEISELDMIHGTPVLDGKKSY